MDLQSFELTLSSGRTVTMTELTARQQMNADSAAKGDPTKVGYYRAVSALTKIGSDSTGWTEYGFAFDGIELDQRIDQLSGREIDEMATMYAAKFSPSPDVLKNVFSALSSASSQPQ